MSRNIQKYCVILLRGLRSSCIANNKIYPVRVIDRITPRRMKIDSPKFRALFTPELIKLNNLFIANKFQLRMAGGAVRDLLMDISPADVDFASDATPSQMKEMFAREGIRTLNKNGEEHGTVTCRIDDKENFEVTTLRIDVVCDGRRAKVEFTTDWQLDANRRDLTINSLFLDLDGTVIDYFGGIQDLEMRRVAFVGDAAQRIQEDYLRILRYFRFFGRIAPSGDSHEEATLNAIVANRNGLANITGERIWSELKKICVGRLGGEVMTVMLERCGLGCFLGLPDSCVSSLGEYRTIFNCNYCRSVASMTLLSSLFASQNDLERFHKRCKLSNIEKTLSEFIIQMRDEAQKNINSAKFFKDLMLDEEKGPSRDRKKISGRERVLELLKYIRADADMIDELERWKMPDFPVNGCDLMDSGIPGGPAMRSVLTHLFDLWKKSDCTMSKEDLLKHVSEVKITEEARRKGNKRKRKDS